MSFKFVYFSLNILIVLLDVCFQMSSAPACTRKNGGVNNHTAQKHSNAWTGKEINLEDIGMLYFA